jgi:hypothetical protein
MDVTQAPVAEDTITFDFTYDSPGRGKGGTSILKVDGTEVDSRKIPDTIPFAIAIDEPFDISTDTRTPVDDHDYQVPFVFTGKIAQVRCKLGPVQLTEEDRKVMHASITRAKD